MIDALESTLIAVLTPSVFLRCYWMIEYSRLVRGTKARYVLATRLVITLSIETATWGGIATINLYKGHAPLAIFQALVMSMALQQLYTVLCDDNWFNDQWKKLKQVLRKLRDVRIQLPLPHPIP